MPHILPQSRAGTPVRPFREKSEEPTVREPVRLIQERTARAVPAETVRCADGWWLRDAPAAAWWVRSVLPHADASGERLVRRVEAAEEFYARRGALARFQISPGACSDSLDSLLAERGYRVESPMSLRTASVARAVDLLGPPPAWVVVDEHPTRAWFDTWHAVHGGDSRAEWALLERVRCPSGFARVMLGGDVVAVGRAVVDTGWAGLFGIATLPRARGRGAARAVVAALAHWAATRHADHLYLQVERDNVAACRLYTRAGFTELCEYHYRTATGPSHTGDGP